MLLETDHQENGQTPVNDAKAEVTVPLTSKELLLFFCLSKNINNSLFCCCLTCGTSPRFDFAHEIVCFCNI